MSADKAHGPTAPPDDTNISGEEAWAHRLSLSAVAPCITSKVETEPRSPHHTSARELPFTVPEVEEGESSETQHRRQTSEVSAFLNSIPLPPEQSASHGPTNCLNQKAINQQTRPSLAQVQRPTPTSPTSMQQCESGPQILPSGGPAQVPTHLGPDERIPEIWKQDSLDGRIGIRPRNKTSNELQQIKDPQYSSGETGSGLPRSMELIIQKFMVGNSYIYPFQHLPEDSQPTYRYSLLTRLDLHNTFKTTKETPDEQRLIKAAWVSIDVYVMVKSDEWRAQGVFTQPSETERPAFAAFTNGWTNRDWDDSTGNSTRATELLTTPPVLPMSVNDPNRGSRPTDPEPVRETTREIIVLDIDTERPNKTCAKLKPARKRRPRDDLNTQVSKRARTRNDSPATNNHDNLDQTYDREYDSDFAIPEEKALVKLIEAIHHVRATMSDLVPTSASDLAIMQQEWTSHGSPSLLTDLMSTGERYTKKMNKYFAHTLQLLSMLKKSGHWKVDGSKVQVDCACQRVHIGAGPEQLQDWESSMIPKQSTILCSSLPEEGAISYIHRQESLFDPPVSKTVNSQAAHLYSAIPGESDQLVKGYCPPVSTAESSQAAYLYPAIPRQSDQILNWDSTEAIRERAQLDRLYRAIPMESDQMPNKDNPPISTTESSQLNHLYSAIPMESDQTLNMDYPPTFTTDRAQAAHLHGAIPRQADQMPDWESRPLLMTGSSHLDRLYRAVPREPDQMPNFDHPPIFTTEKAQI